jgi:hypothetical protein
VHPLTVAVVAAVLVAAFLVLYWGAVPLVGDPARRGAANAAAIAGIERGAGIDVEAVQRSGLARGWSGQLLTWWYAVGYWPVLAGALAIAAALDRPTLWRALSALALSGGVGVVTMTLFPVSPPRLVGAAADQVGRSELLGALAHPSGLFNPHAAMPSFHVAWTVLAVLTLTPVARRWGGAAAGLALWALPAVMSVAVVTTGNHWVLDAVAGLALAVIVWWAAPWNVRVIRRSMDRPEPLARRTYRRPVTVGGDRCGAGAAPGCGRRPDGPAREPAGRPGWSPREERHPPGRSTAGPMGRRWPGR